METDNTEKRDTCAMIKKIKASTPFYLFVLMVMISVSDPTARSLNPCFNGSCIVTMKYGAKIQMTEEFQSLF